MESILIAGLRKVAAAYDTSIDNVSVSFDHTERQAHPDDNGSYWRVTVRRPPVDKRRKGCDSTSGSGDTFDEAVDHVISLRASADQLEGRK